MSQNVKQILSGPVPSIRTPFDAEGEIDFPALGRLVDHCIQGGSKVLMLTAGDSHYICLSDQEIADVTTFVCRQAKGKAHVIAADRYHSSKRAAAFARFAGEAGALCVMTMPPDWAGSTTPQTLAEHYAFVARELPVMVVTNLYNVRGAAFGIKALELAVNASDNVVSVKDDTCGDFSRQLCNKFQDRLSILAGGQKVNHLAMHPFGGGHGYLSTFASLVPAVTNAYWSAYQSGDMARCYRVYREIDLPFFETVMATPGGFDAGIHAAMQALGICQRHRRKPYYTPTDKEVEPVVAFMQTVESRLSKIMST